MPNKGLPFGGNESINGGNYVELLHLMEKDDKLAKHLKESTVFVGTPNRIQNDPTETSDFVRCHIKSDINAASFVAVKVDETTDKTRTERKRRKGTGNVRMSWMHYRNMNALRN